MRNQLDRATSTYLQDAIEGESPLGLIARVYELAGVEIARARAAVASGDAAAKGKAVHRASRCIDLLRCSLNMERGGDVAANLDRLYEYLLRRLTQAHVANDDAALLEIARHLAELGSAWRQASQGRTQSANDPDSARQEPAAAGA